MRNPFLAYLCSSDFLEESIGDFRDINMKCYAEVQTVYKPVRLLSYQCSDVVFGLAESVF